MVINFAVVLRNCHRRVDIFMLEFRKCASRGSEPTRDFGDLFTGFRQLRVKGVRIEVTWKRTGGSPDGESWILTWFVMQLPAPCRNFDYPIARKIHRIRHAFWRAS